MIAFKIMRFVCLKEALHKYIYNKKQIKTL